MDSELIDFIFRRANDFVRLSENEPFNDTAAECVRFFVELLFRCGVPFGILGGRFEKL